MNVADDRQTDERQEQDQAVSGSEEKSDALKAAEKAKEEEEEAKEQVKQLEDDPPEKLEDWPDDKAKYETFGGPEGEESYDESVTGKLGPSSLRYREDGSVEIEGEEVDDPDEYKAEPIPGGPTDPRASETRAYGEPDLTDETSVDPENPPGSEGEGESGGEGESQEEGTSEGTSDDDGGDEQGSS
jgi:hypothetical protein